MDSTIAASLISATASIITAVISSRPRSDARAARKGYSYRQPQKLPWIIIVLLLLVWLGGSPILLHWDIASLNIFVIVMVTLVLAFFFPIRPGAAAATVLILHPANFFSEDLGKFFHGVTPNFPFSSSVGVDASTVILLLSIYFANAIVASLLCLWRARVPANEPSAQGAGRARPLADDLERIAVLHSRGILTDEEFQAAKRRLLGL